MFDVWNPWTLKEDVFQRLIIGRELDVLWSGEPDLRIDELGSLCKLYQVVPLAARSKFCYNGSIHLTRNRTLFPN